MDDIPFKRHFLFLLILLKNDSEEAGQTDINDAKKKRYDHDKYNNNRRGADRLLSRGPCDLFKLHLDFSQKLQAFSKKFFSCFTRSGLDALIGVFWDGVIFFCRSFTGSEKAAVLLIAESFFSSAEIAEEAACFFFFGLAQIFFLNSRPISLLKW